MSFALSQSACVDTATVEFEVDGRPTGIVVGFLGPTHAKRRAFDLDTARAITAKARKNPAQVGSALYKDPEDNIAAKTEEILLATTGWFTKQKDGSLLPGIELEQGQHVEFSAAKLREVIEDPKFILFRNFCATAMDDVKNFTPSSSAT